MASFISGIALFSLVVISFTTSGEGCSCQMNHPQKSFCNSQFVIRAFVSRVHMVEIKRNGNFRRMDSRDKHDPAESPDLGEAEEDTENDDDRIRPNATDSAVEANATVEANETLHHSGDGANMFVNNGPELSEVNGSGDTTRIKRSVRTKKSNYGYYPYGGPPGRPWRHDDSRSTKKIMVQYKLHIAKVFKGLENSTELQKKFLYSPYSSSLCHVKLSTDKTPYILTGQIRNGLLEMDLCNYKIDLDKLTKIERKNVMRNLETRYPKSCSLCSVKVCDRGGCDDTYNDPYTCQWKQWSNAASAEACQYTCLPTKKGECKWFNPIDRIERAGRF